MEITGQNRQRSVLGILAGARGGRMEITRTATVYYTQGHHS